ncbi:NACHT domain-containing protein [Fusarium heterosporum]|uniref:NACHT domain-containing protein n=1 Tax=Fusarium heterosporum TaxID=42747 RepID=A0A8H5T8W3_FUSHE|nr:NACHT domain-containing protein [Fusarium heterosporum]
MSLPDPAQAAFNKAIREFKTGLNNPALYTEILATTSIDQVYDLTDQLQQTQGRAGRLTNLARIGVFLERMNTYAGVIDTFVQVKPDILALIWGPIKLLILWTSNTTKSLDALIGVTEKLGILLPEFDHAVKLFGNKRHVNQVLALLFQDMLDFYLVSLKFFGMTGLKVFFEALWPKRKEEIEGVIERLEEHTGYLRNEVRLQDIQEASEARQHAIKSFAKLEESDRRQEYEALETAIRPVFYGQKLGHLLNRVCDGTGDWLIENEDMRRWFRVLPGSEKIIWKKVYSPIIFDEGKTYLSAYTIKEARSHGNTVFAFLSHEQKNISVNSVINSFVFQLARNSPALQDMVRQISRDTLEHNLAAAVDLFIKLIEGNGHVLIIIDGLDEIGEIERVSLLRQMIKVTDDCNGARLLISSRLEDNIKAILEKRSKAICVDTHNANSIHVYTKRRCQDWLRDRSFNRQDSDEITALIGGVAQKAEGMFLYAHLVLRGLDYLHSIAEIRQDLNILPKDLNAAYGRIFTRINNSLPNEAVREKARKALGWIGCSPSPLTIRELEQALVVKIGDLDQDLKGITQLNLCHLCGPIVEEIDGKLHLIHFTAKEYFFSPSIENHLDPGGCVLSLAKCCITYLCQHHHDKIDAELFRQNVIDGIYRLHHFASDNWSYLVLIYLKTASKPQKEESLVPLIALISLLGMRINTEFLQSDSRIEYSVLEPLQTSEDQSAYDLVCNELQFHVEASSRLFEIGNGFRSRKERKTHSKTHDRPWTCEFDNCEYQVIGFISRQMRDRHLDNAHRVEGSLESAIDVDTDNAETFLVLKALIRANEAIPNKYWNATFQKLSTGEMLEVAAEVGSWGNRGAIELLEPEMRGNWRLMAEFLRGAFESENQVALTWLQLSSSFATVGFYQCWMTLMGQSDPESLFLQTKDWLIRKVNVGEVTLLSDGLISPMKNIYSRESLLIRLWDEIFEKINVSQEGLYDALCELARTTCSTRLARWLIEHGAPVDCPLKCRNSKGGAKEGPPIVLASTKKTLESARFIRLLLYQGADPECNIRAPSCRNAVISTRAGPNIQKWLNISWDDLTAFVRVVVT